MPRPNPRLNRPGVAARDGIALLPSEGLGAFLQHLDGGHRIVGIARVARLQTGDVHQAELDRVDSERVRHFVHHVFPGPLGFLLDVAARRAGARCVGAVGAPHRSPVGNLRRVQLQLVGGVARTVACPPKSRSPHAHVDFVVERDDAAVFLRAHFELGDGLRLDLQLRQFLILGQHHLHRAAR